MRYTLSLTFFYVAAYAFITGSPDVYIRYYGVAPQHYGWLFAVNIVGVMLMSVVNRRLVQRHALGSLLLAWLHDGTPWTMAWIMAAFTLASLLLAWLHRRVD